MKRTLAFVLALVMMAAALATFAGCSKKTYTIGICQLIKHDALDAATKGFRDAVIKELGAENVTFLEQNAQGDSTACTTIVNDFVSKKVDLIMANATPALQAAYNATQTIPVLGTSITEYSVALDLKGEFNGVVGGNVSGTSDLAPLDEQAAMLTELFPEAKKVGLLYCSAEPNSLYQVKVIEEELAKKNVTCEKFTFTDSNDVAAVSQKAAAASDVIYIPTDNTAASNKALINANIGKTPAICGEEGICEGCGVATLSISYYDLGYKTGEMAAKILKKEAKISEMKIEYAPAVKKYNAAKCAELGITPPEGYTAIAAAQ